MKKAFLFFVFLCAFVGGIVLSSFIISKILLREKIFVLVPDVKGKELIEAWQILRRGSLELKIESFQYSETVPKYVIIEQKPKAGEKIEKKRAVFVVLSLGPQKFYIPDIIALDFEMAKVIIEESGLNLKSILKVHSSKPENEVIGQYPPPGSEVSFRDLSVLISMGAHPKNYVSSDFSGMGIEDLQNFFSSYEIHLKIQYVYPEIGVPYTVFQQFPSPGMKISDKDGVEVIVPGSPAEGRVLKIKIPYGFLKKFLVVNINYEDWKMSLFRDTVEGGRVFYFFVSADEKVEVFLDGKKISKSLYSK